MNVIECKGLVKEFHGTRAVDDLDLEVPKGTIFGLLGPNGSGKTTTIRVALGIYLPDGGSVQTLNSPRPMDVRERIGYLPEERGLYPRMKVREQLAFLASIRGLSIKEADRRARYWLDLLGLGDRSESMTNEFSKGMQQKVQFASSVIHDPELIVLDEPFTGLDPLNARQLKELVLKQSQKGTTVVLSTHRMEQVEAMCEWIHLIHGGRTVLTGKLKEIRASYGKSAIEIEYQGTADGIGDVPGVVSVQDSAGRARLEITKESNTQEILKQLLDTVALSSFRLDEPHLEEIYIEKIGGSLGNSESKKEESIA